MNLQQLRYVRALVEEGSFVAAASRCAVTQPTLSNGIAQLEAEIGHRIFRRTTRSVSLTNYGEQVLPAILETLKAFDYLRELVKRIGSGSGLSVHVGLSPVVGIRQAEDMLEPYHARRPEIGLIYHEGNLDELCDLLRRSEIDIIVSPIAHRSAPVSDCVMQLLRSEPLFFIPRKEDSGRWAGKNSVSIKDIADEQFVLVPNVCGLTQVTKTLFDEHSCMLNRYPGEASSYAVVSEWAKLGLGSGILPQSKIAQDRSGHQSIPIMKDGLPVEIEYWALGKPNTVPPELFAELWETLQAARVKQRHMPADAVAVPAYDWFV